MASRLAACTCSCPRKGQPKLHETKCKASSVFLLLLDPSVSVDISETTRKPSPNIVLLILKSLTDLFQQ